MEHSMGRPRTQPLLPAGPPPDTDMHVLFDVPVMPELPPLAFLLLHDWLPAYVTALQSSCSMRTAVGYAACMRGFLRVAATEGLTSAQRAQMFADLADTTRSQFQTAWKRLNDWTQHVHHVTLPPIQARDARRDLTQMQPALLVLYSILAVRLNVRIPTLAQMQWQHLTPERIQDPERPPPAVPLWRFDRFGKAIAAIALARAGEPEHALFSLPPGFLPIGVAPLTAARPLAEAVWTRYRLWNGRGMAADELEAALPELAAPI